MSKKKNNSNIKITSTGREYIDLSGEAGIELAQEIIASGIFEKKSDNKETKSRQKRKNS